MNENQMIAWKGLFFNTIELLRIEKLENGFKCSGQVTGEVKGRPLQANYGITADNDWRIKQVSIEVISDTVFSFQLSRDGENRWMDENGKHLPAFDGCGEIDISLTPFTNTFPVKKLRLQNRESQEFEVVYFDVLNKQIKKNRQRYTRIAAGVYQYENLASGFTAAIETDSNDIVINYPGIWTGVYTGNAPGFGLVTNKNNTDFSSVLISSNRCAELNDEEDLYGRFTGSWELEVNEYSADGSVVKTDGNWVFSRVLEGRAIQDIFIVPGLSRRYPGMSKAGNRYGATIRMYDKQAKKWTINWYNPVNAVHNELTATMIGNDIVQEGVDTNGNFMRWSFRDICPDSFRWTGEVSADKGKTWKLAAEFRASRYLSSARI